MDGQKSLEMGRSGTENLPQEDEVFHALSPLNFRYPESSGINFDLDATYLLDNPSGKTIHSSMDVLPDSTVVSEGGISVVQAGEPDQGIPGTNFSNFPTPGVNSLHVPSQEMTGMSFTNLLTQGSSITTLEYSSQGLSMIDLLNPPTQVTYVNTLELSNQGSSRMDTFGLPTQESFTNTLEFPNYNLPMTDALSSPAPQFTSIGFLNHEQSMNTSGVPYQTQPVFMTMGENKETEEMNTSSSSDDEQFQDEFDPNDGNGNGNGASGSNSNLPLRQTLSKEMISQYFHLSLTNAAKALNVGKTVLKTRCRELHIGRWPQRKFKSLQTIISHLEKSGESSGIRVGENVQERIRRLENERKRMEDNPDLPLEDDTIRLRQACFKSSHRKRKQSDRDL